MRAIAVADEAAGCAPFGARIAVPPDPSPLWPGGALRASRPIRIEGRACY